MSTGGNTELAYLESIMGLYKDNGGKVLGLDPQFRHANWYMAQG